MKHSTLLVIALAAASTPACKKDKPADPVAEPAGSGSAAVTAPAIDKPVADKPADPKPLTLPPDVELELSAWGEAWKGYVVTAPEGTKVELDDPSRTLTINDDDYVTIGEAPGYDDMVAGLANDKDNSEINKVSAGETRWLRNPPLGKQWNFDLKLDAMKGWDCSGNTFTSAEMADKLVAICKSIKKK